MVDYYLKNIYKTYKAGDAVERSYYPDLKRFFEDFLSSKGIDPNITIEAKKTEAGIPDFTVRKAKELIGYVEAKDLTIEDLQTVEESDQIKKYKEKLPNFILTNYFDFWLWRRDTVDEKKGQWIKKVRIGMPRTLKFNTPPLPQKEKEFFELLEAFFRYYLPERRSAKSLAVELASRAQLMPPYIIDELDNKDSEVYRVYSAFTEYLIADLSREDFADIYSQTITYGLFTARLRYKGKEFNRFLAQELVPKNIEILHDTFHLISHDKLTESLAWIIDDLATVLAHADMEKIKAELHQEKGGDDPLMHFYETFLAEYDPKKRKARGVYYTPLPVVSYITRSINALLKDKFGKEQGFASKGVTLLDPASGTLTFPANAIKIAKQEVDNGPRAGSWLQIVQEHILKDFYAFELLMAPYIIGHLKASLLLEDLGYELKNSDRFQLYLTNTLDLGAVKQSNLPFVSSLSQEAQKAKKVKEEEKILVVMGNPPYSFTHSVQSEFVKDSMKDYLTGLGVENERKKGVMQDDYIRFIRFAHFKIEQAGQGAIGMITNNSYLDGIIHRAMRKKLLDDFDEVYILNLHGNSRLKEKTPQGEKDENVFDIQQGVAIVLLIKVLKTRKKPKPSIRFFELYGQREDKYQFLETKDIKKTKWEILEPKEPYYFFVPKDMMGEKKYDKFISLSEIFSENGSGVITRRDDFAIADTKDELERRMRIFLDKNFSKEMVAGSLGINDTYEWDLEKARDRLKKDENFEKNYFEYLYRPFDKRWIIYHDNLVSRPSSLLSKCFPNHNNVGLLCSRRTPTGVSFNHVLVSDLLADIHSAADQTYVFPLYLYNDNQYDVSSKKEKSKFGYGTMMLFDAPKPARKSNIKGEILTLLVNKYGKNVSPEEVFYYIYAVLYSKKYRQKYNEFLKIDFPKIPFTADYKLFKAMSKSGNELVALHLLKSEKLEKPAAKFPEIGKSNMEKREYKNNRIYINDKQYFGGVKEEVWAYYIGGYQVLDKWLKDRTGKILSAEDVNHFLKVISVLQNTIKLQSEIDKIYLDVEKKLV